MIRSDQRSLKSVTCSHHWRGAAEVAGALAGVDEVAAGAAHRVRVVDLSAQRRGRRLVEAAHALVDLAVADHREPLLGQGHHLDVDEAELPGDGRGPGRRGGGRPRCPRRPASARWARKAACHPCSTPGSRPSSRRVRPLEPAPGHGGRRRGSRARRGPGLARHPRRAEAVVAPGRCAVGGGPAPEHRARSPSQRQATPRPSSASGALGGDGGSKAARRPRIALGQGGAAGDEPVAGRSAGDRGRTPSWRA